VLLSPQKQKQNLHPHSMGTVLSSGNNKNNKHRETTPKNRKPRSRKERPSSNLGWLHLSGLKCPQNHKTPGPYEYVRWTLGWVKKYNHFYQYSKTKKKIFFKLRYCLMLSKFPWILTRMVTTILYNKKPFLWVLLYWSVEFTLMHIWNSAL